jgi:hypothetical protein
MGPVVAQLGTTVFSCVSDIPWKEKARHPLNVTYCVPVKFVPLIVTCVPGVPLVGVNEVTVGGAVEFTKKACGDPPEPPALVTKIEPLVAPLGTTAVNCVSDMTWNDPAAAPLNVTCVAPVKLIPVTVTLVPTDPLLGVKELTCGCPVKVLPDEPLPDVFVTLIGPLTPPPGTTAVNCVSDAPRKNPAGMPLKLTPVVPVKLAPVTVTVVPAGPLGGEKELTAGNPFEVGVKLVADAPIPAPLIT